MLRVATPRWARLTTQLAAVGLVAASLTSAPAAADHDADRFPPSEGWFFSHDVLRVPAGYACDGPVRMRYRAHQRILVNGEPLLDPSTYQPKAGDRGVGQSPDARVWVTNVRTGRTLYRSINGYLDERVQRNLKDTKGKGVGRNLFFGRGVRGILFATGVQFIYTKNYFSDDPTLSILRVKGPATNLCRTLGLKPVPGRNPTTPPIPVRCRTCQHMHRDYVHGVGRPGARDVTEDGSPVTTFTVNPDVYRVNRQLDTDRDGIACESA